MTVVVVSHDIASTMRMAAQVLVLLPDGAVEGTPAELQRSTDPRVASFLNPDLDDAALGDVGRVEAAPQPPRGAAHGDARSQDLGWASLRFVEELGRLALFAGQHRRRRGARRRCASAASSTSSSSSACCR